MNINLLRAIKGNLLHEPSSSLEYPLELAGPAKVRNNTLNRTHDSLPV